jgi:flagellar protein FliO/FliZ
MDALFVTLRVVVALAAVLGLLWYVQRRMARGKRTARRTSALHVVSRQSVGSKASVVLVEADGTRFLLGVTEHNVNVLHATASSATAFAGHVAAAVPDLVEVDAPTTGSRETSAAERVVQLGPRRAARAVQPAPVHPASGSILSPDTWKQAVAAVRHSR